MEAILISGRFAKKGGDYRMNINTARQIISRFHPIRMKGHVFHQAYEQKL